MGYKWRHILNTVCKGDQVLEMIRSEPEFADIPVVFLTDRVDRESVTKVLEFKPDGYLSKVLKPDLIKEEIDQFFRGERSEAYMTI